MDRGARLTETHLAALDWFADRAGQVVPWSELNKREQRLAIMPKGIYRPKDWHHSLSIKIIPGSGYPNEEVSDPDGGSRFRYHQETPGGIDPATFASNEGLANCMEDGVPVGVIRRASRIPHAQYEVLGLGQVLDWKDDFFAVKLVRGLPRALVDLQGQLEVGASSNLGDEEELRLRQETLRRLDALDAKLEELSRAAYVPGMGHNMPPEGLAHTINVNVTVAVEARDVVAGIREELRKAEPDPVQVARKSSWLKDLLGKLAIGAPAALFLGGVGQVGKTWAMQHPEVVMAGAAFIDQVVGWLSHLVAAPH